MIDYLSATLYYSDKDNPNMGFCHKEALYKSGWQSYSLPGVSIITVMINPYLKTLRLKGSLLYYAQGYNFVGSNNTIIEAVDVIGKQLGISLWKADIDNVEYGKIIEVEDNPKEYIMNHREKKGSGLVMNENPKDKGCFRWWDDKMLVIKMYDAGKNIKQKCSKEIQSYIEKEGWDPGKHYLKFEVKYKKPHVMFNSGGAIRLGDIVTPRFEKMFNDDLMNQYSRLEPKRDIVAGSKKELNTASITVRTLIDEMCSKGKTLQEVQKRLYKEIDCVSEEVLSIADKKARKRGIKRLFDSLELEGKSRWDISEKLKEVI